MNTDDIVMTIWVICIIAGITGGIVWVCKDIIRSIHEYSEEQEYKQLDKERRKAAKKARREELKRLREYNRD